MLGEGVGMEYAWGRSRVPLEDLMTGPSRSRIRGTLPVVEASARTMRRQPTPAERVLWQTLRTSPFGGYGWRRQHPVGRFVLDFCCPQLRLVVALDGDVHMQQAGYDEDRTAHLAIHGYHVIRFANRDVFDHPEVVIATIASACNKRAPLPPAKHPPTPPDGSTGSPPHQRCGGVREGVGG